jgi:hypothetical protein
MTPTQDAETKEVKMEKGEMTGMRTEMKGLEAMKGVGVMKTYSIEMVEINTMKVLIEVVEITLEMTTKVLINMGART